jgi:lipopolysaccharide/colanic/teichoic acid biosynthesis glycosyltransferase
MLSPAEGTYRTGSKAALLPKSWAPPRKPLRVLPVSHVEVSYRSDPVRRTLNVIVALVGLVLLAPVMVVIAILIKLTSPGPVLYTQPRVGLDRRSSQGGNWRRRVDYGGRIFMIYKFRTMTAAKPGAAELWASPDDPRVTRVGRVLRKYRLDEIPQLVNVLRGEMNVVGPRPEQPGIFMNLREKIDGYQNRQKVVPGITGWAQINQHYDRDIEDVRRKLQYDLEYAERQSMLEDLKIMALTLPVIVFRKGAW